MTRLNIQQIAESLQPKLVEIRRDLHQHPELSNREFRTANKVAEYLKNLGLSVQTGVAHTGVIGLLEGSRPGSTVAVRADMDALPIQELNEMAYRSRYDGVKHACGHDVHTTIGLGVAETLSQLREHFQGRVKFIFQPAEEGAPAGETGGAYLMLEEGVLDNPPVEAILALHVMPTLEVGKLGYQAGPVWASNDTLEVVIHGRKTHGAYPHTGVDAILVASHVLQAVQTLVNRSVDVRDPLLISFGVIEGGNQFNVLADEVRLLGIMRCHNPEIRRSAPARIDQLLGGITGSFGASHSLKMTPGAPVTLNHSGLLKKAVPVLEAAVGKENVLLQKPQMGAEDFACFAERVPGFYFLLGVRNESRGITEMLHTPRFDVDESCLSIGVHAMSRLVMDCLS
ncbi:MAG: M20 family metallopeptidase [Acidobacteria bacterium]|nr:M20 family metallopeptidase [Acidobacteriota bacterium]MCI0719985.1 M20 family metallopeptidase [Acidobacteriota bacterium]